MTDKQDRLDLFNASILIACATAYIYFCAFEYENGYCVRFKIPNYLIEPSLNTLLVFASAAFLISLASLYPIGFTLPLLDRARATNKKHLSRIYRMNFFLFVMGVFFISLFQQLGRLVFCLLVLY